VNNAMSSSLAPPPSFLATPRGKVTLALLRIHRRIAGPAGDSTSEDLTTLDRRRT